MAAPTIPYDASRRALFHPDRSETVFVEASRPQLAPLAVEACRLAYYKAEAGPAQQARLEAAWRRVGFMEVQPFFVPDADAQGFGALRVEDGLAVIAFRGTEPEKLADLGTNASILPIAVPEIAGCMHAGFHLAYRALEPQVTGWLATKQPRVRKLVVCGHSLGGAMATVCAQAVQPRPALLLTIGCPRVGDKAFVAALAGVPQERIVNCCDFVTTLPPSLFGYRHPDAFTYVTAAGELLSSPAAGVVRKDREAARARYAEEHAWQFGAASLRDHADHAPANYVRAFF